MQEHMLLDTRQSYIQKRCIFWSWAHSNRKYVQIEKYKYTKKLCTKLVHLQDHAYDWIFFFFRSLTSQLFHCMYIRDSCIAIYLSPACKPTIHEKDEIANSFDRGGKGPTFYKTRPWMVWVDAILTICSLWHHGSQNNLSSKVQTFYDGLITYIRLICGLLRDALHHELSHSSLIADVTKW